MGGLSYIEGGGGQISENLQSFVEISNTKEIREPNCVKGGTGEVGYYILYFVSQ